MITQAVDGRIWCGTTNGVAELAPGDSTFTLHRLNRNDNDSIPLHVHEMVFTSPTELVMATDHGFYTYDIENNTAKRHAINDEHGQFLVNQLKKGPDGNIWVASRYRGLARWSPEGRMTWYRHSDEDSRSPHTNQIISSDIDQYGNLWVGSLSGVDRARLTSRATQLVVNSDQTYSPANRVYRVLNTSDGELLMLSRGGLFVHQDDDRFGQRFPGSERIALINSICESSDGSIWMPANKRGLYRKARGEQQFKPYKVYPEPDSWIIFKIINDAQDPDILWLGTSNGFGRLDQRTGRITFFKPTDHVEVPSDHLIVFDEDEEHIWLYYSFAGELGLFDKTTGEFEILLMPEQDKFMLEGVVKDAQLHNGSFWLATGHGLTRYSLKDGKFKMYATSSGLADSDIITVLVDANDDLWAVGNRFIAKFHPEDETFESFDFGMRVRSFSPKAKSVTKNGKIWLGSFNGAFAFHPDSLRIDKVEPRVNLTNFEVNNARFTLDTAYEYVSEIKLKSDENDINFEFTAIQLAAPELITYKCKLEGFDTDWTDLQKRRSKNYTNLDHGEYVFRVMAANQDGVWSAPGLRVRVVIAPPFTATLWFNILVSFLVILIIYFGVRLWSHQQRLRREKTIAEQSAAYRAEFLAHTSHEVRTPLNAILGLSRLARQTDNADDKSRYVDSIETASNNLLKIVNDLLDHSKLESGTFNFNKKKFHLGDVADQMTALFDTLASGKGLHFELELSGDHDAGFVIGDELRLVQILTNLVGNAIKFTDEGSVKLKMDLTRTHADKAIAKIEVKDTGKGIEPAALDSVFERFYESGAASGSGLGLYITRQLVEHQGGTIDLQSEVGKGTIATVRMPFMFVESQRTETHTGDKLRILHDELNVLSVDDAPFNHLVLTEMLRKHAPNARVDQAANGLQAIEMSADKDYDIIIMDAKMPEMDGFETSQVLRGKGYARPILGATASATPDVLKKCIDSGMTDVITKPIDANKLIEKITLLCSNNAKV